MREIGRVQVDIVVHPRGRVGAHQRSPRSEIRRRLQREIEVGMAEQLQVLGALRGHAQRLDDRAGH